MKLDKIRKALEVKIRRATPYYEKLNNTDWNMLSVWGFEQMGYFKGVITTCEDLLDVLEEMESKSNAE